MNRREFLQLLALASASGLALNSKSVLSASGTTNSYYDLPAFGNVSIMHMTDCHAQLKPIYFREPNVNIGLGSSLNKPPHLVGEELLKYFNIRPSTMDSHAFTYLDFDKAAKVYGKVGGFAHLSTLVKQVRASRPGSLLLDGGDTWQGSATALWTKGQDMVEACKLLGVDVMTGHWEFTLGAERVKHIIENDFKGKLDFVAQNVKTLDFGDPVFKPYVIKHINKIPVAIVGQAFPYTPIANPRHMIPDWSFGIQDENMQKVVDDARAEGAQLVVVISHNGMDVDLKMASRVTGIDAIMGGHTHDGIPAPSVVKNRSGQTLVTNAGSNGKFLGVMDFDVRGGKVAGFKYKLLPVFANLIQPDAEMDALIKKIRAPFEKQLSEKLAITEGPLYRRGNFNGTFDQLILDALMEVKGADAAFSPGFRWGTSLLPGETITYEHVMDQTAITYPQTTLTHMTGDTIKIIMEDVCDNLFNPDPYKQQGGDMVRVGGISYTCDLTKGAGKRINNMMLNGKALDPNKKYKVAGWAPVGESVVGEPIYDLVSNYLRSEKKVITTRKLNLPKLIGVKGNQGIA
jgi:sulfur-oxidizing protein SoxB